MSAADRPSRKTPDFDPDQVMQADWAWYLLHRRRHGNARFAAESAERLGASAARRRVRDKSVPEVVIDERLPIAAHTDEIIAAVKQHQVVIVAGDTGSGKSTQLPKLCLAAGRGRRGLIGCTQPRRIAARSLALRVAEELGTEPGSLVGYQVRFRGQLSEQTLVKFMTDGILLAEAQRDRFFDRYDTLIIDEAHERSLNIDFLLGLIRRVLPKRPDLRVIVTSATIDTASFAAFFDAAPVIDVAGRGYPVEIRYRPLPEARGERGLYQGIADAIDELTALDRQGDILVFLPGEREIREAGRFLRRRNLKHTEILPLYARIGGNAQMQIFRPGHERRIVLSTNIAETSLTVPRIRYVIDSGLARISRFSPGSRIQRLPVEPVSQASANQRSGRCGRLAPGVAIRLYSEEDFGLRPAYTEPEILRTSLAMVILRMLAMRLGSIDEFPFIEPPSRAMIREGMQSLRELRAVDEQEALTAGGRELAGLPIDARLARMLQVARERGCLHEILAIAAALSIQDPRERPLEQAGEADDKHSIFTIESSDFLTLYRLWTVYHGEKEQRGSSALRRWCEQHFINYPRMREWLDLRRQLHQQVRELGWPVQPARALEPPVADVLADAIHQSLLAGMLSSIGLRDEDEPARVKPKRKRQPRTYTGARGRRFSIFPGSVLAGKAPRWIIAAELVETTRVYARGCAAIKPEWIEEQGAHLLKTACYDPWWDARKGRVMAWQRATLYGLVVYDRRQVQYEGFDFEDARRIFIEQALVADDLQLPEAREPGFLCHNRALVAELEAEEHKRRRHDVLEREQHRIGFFNERLPAGIASTQALLAWRRRHPDDRRLCYEREWLSRNDAGLDQSDAWPDELRLDGHAFALHYRFEPGAADDGVSIRIPLEWLNRLAAPRLDWLVPGLWLEKLQALIQTLPKPQRRRFSPTGQFARAVHERILDLDPGEREALMQQPLTSVLAGYLHEMTGEDSKRLDWRPDELPAHLRMRIVIDDGRGGELDSGRDLDALRQRHGRRARRAFMERQGGDWQRDDVQAWDFGDLPESVTTASGVPAWPALVTDQGRDPPGCHLRLFDDPDEAALAHRDGVLVLLGRQLRDKLRYARKQHGFNRSMQLQAAALGGWQALSEQINDCALAALVDDAGPVLREQQFDELCAETARQLLPRRRQYLDVLGQILDAYHELRRRLDNDCSQRFPEAAADLLEQLGDLVYPGFLADLHWDNLRHYPRYLQAMRQRLDKLPQDPGADRRRMAKVRPYWQRYLHYMAGGGEYNNAVDQYRWLIEEFRVSLFAQQLGTAGKVSEKRLQHAWDRVNEHSS